MTEKTTTVAAVSLLASGLAKAQGSGLVITMEDVRSHMAWVQDPRPNPSPVPEDRTRFIVAAMNFLLSEDVPRA